MGLRGLTVPGGTLRGHCIYMGHFRLGALRNLWIHAYPRWGVSRDPCFCMGQSLDWGLRRTLALVWAAPGWGSPAPGSQELPPGCQEVDLLPVYLVLLQGHGLWLAGAPGSLWSGAPWSVATVPLFLTAWP